VGGWFRLEAEARANERILELLGKKVSGRSTSGEPDVFKEPTKGKGLGERQEGVGCFDVESSRSPIGNRSKKV
jgi:hypothetical protein